MNKGISYFLKYKCRPFFLGWNRVVFSIVFLWNKILVIVLNLGKPYCAKCFNPRHGWCKCRLYDISGNGRVIKRTCWESLKDIKKRGIVLRFIAKE